MILTCPNCKAKYLVKDEVVGISGTDVTCPTCAHQWHQKPDVSAMQPIKEKRADQIYIDHRLARQAQAIQNGKRFIWASMALFLVGGLSLAYVARNTVVSHWSEASSIYWAMGLDVNRYGVEWVGLNQKRTFDGTRPIVKVSGVIKNIRDEEKKLPLVELHLNDEHGDTIEIRYAEFPYSTIKQAERIRVEFEVADPPSESTNVELHFVDSLTDLNAKLIRIEDITR